MLLTNFFFNTDKIKNNSVIQCIVPNKREMYGEKICKIKMVIKNEYDKKNYIT